MQRRDFDRVHLSAHAAAAAVLASAATLVQVRCPLLSVASDLAVGACTAGVALHAAARVHPGNPGVARAVLDVAVTTMPDASTALAILRVSAGAESPVRLLGRLAKTAISSVASDLVHTALDLSGAITIPLRVARALRAGAQAYVVVAAIEDACKKIVVAQSEGGVSNVRAIAVLDEARSASEEQVA